MANQNQKFEQIKRDPANEVQKINLGWKGYVPGYKNRVVGQINTQIEEQSRQFDRSASPIGRLPVGSQSYPKNTDRQDEASFSQEAAMQQAAQEEQGFLEDEEQLADFALNQDIAQAEQQIDELNDKIAYFSGPSAMKYLLLLVPLALVVDILDIIGYFMAATVAGVTITILLLFVSVVLNCIIIFIFWFTDYGVKEARGYPAKVNLFIADTAARIKEIRILNQGRLSLKAAWATQSAEEITKAQRAIRMARTTARTARVARFAGKTVGSPIAKLVGGGLLNAAPGLGIAPIMSISLLLTYLSERKVYRQAREAAEQAKQEILASMAEVV